MDLQTGFAAEVSVTWLTAVKEEEREEDEREKVREDCIDAGGERGRMRGKKG